MSKKGISEKEVPIKHKESHVLRNVMLMSVGTFVALLIRKASTNPAKKFYAKRIA